MNDKIDWSGCALVQCDAEYVSGKPALRGNPRMTVETFVDCYELGMEPDEIATTYGVPEPTVTAILDYAARHRVSTSTTAV